MEYLAKLIDKQFVAHRTRSLVFETPKGFSFKAGQYVVIQLPEEACTAIEGPEGVTDPIREIVPLKEQMRSMSIDGVPGAPSLAITYRLSDSLHKKVIEELPLGSMFRLKGPYGRFVYRDDSTKKHIFLAGGIGITPVRSIILDQLGKGNTIPMSLVYSSKTLDDFAYLGEFEHLAHEKKLTFYPTITREAPEGWKYETGRISPAMIKIACQEDYANSLFYLVGHNEFVEQLSFELETLGVAKENIIFENFW